MGTPSATLRPCRLSPFLGLVRQGRTPTHERFPMYKFHKHKILPRLPEHDPIPVVSAAVRPSAPAMRRVATGNNLSAADRARRAQGALIPPTITGVGVTISLGGHKWRLPVNVAVAFGRGGDGRDLCYVSSTGGRVTVLTATDSGVMELVIDLQLADEIRNSLFSR